MKPYAYQEKYINEIFASLKTKDRLLFTLATGGGKTAVFSFIAKKFIKESNKKVLVLAHREELVNQTLATLRTIGVTCESVVASKKQLQHHSNCYVAMIATLSKRLEKDPEFLKDVGLIIIDEAHILIHSKVFKYFDKAKILAVTATPTLLKKVNFTKCHVCKKEYDNIETCCNYETYEYSRRFTLSEIYEDIIVGTSISELIMSDDLVRDLVYSTGSVDRSKLTIDAKTGDFDTKSADEQFANSYPDVVKNYEEIAKGKKTIVFNSSAKVNALVLQSFLDAGYVNVKLFDSVNETENRKKVLQWFKETPDAILLNVSCFTTGFDEPSVECVIVNRSTLSLSLYLQMVGRAGRKCDTIYKPHFTHIDLGGNVENFGKWSDERDWDSHFFGSNEKPKAKKEALDQTKMCTKCDAIITKNSVECMYCGNVEIELRREKTMSNEIALLNDEIPKPNGKKIIAYVGKIERDKNFAWVILQNQILDMFIRHSVTFGMYNKAEKNGKFEESMRTLIKEPYQTIQGSELDGGIFRTKAYIVGKIKNKLEKYYNL